MTKPGARKVCLLVDGDNISPIHVDRLMTEARSHGRVTIARVYGDFSSSRLGSWKAAALNVGLEPVMVASPVTGKNATDLALAIDAIEYGLGGLADTFVIASGDSDFMLVAARLRRSGVGVHAIGQSTAPMAYRNSCDSFVEVDNGRARELQRQAGIALVPGRDEQPDQYLRRSLDHAWESCHKNNGLVLLSALGAAVKRCTADLDMKKSGYAKFADMVRGVGGYEIVSDPGSETVQRVRRIVAQ